MIFNSWEFLVFFLVVFPLYLRLGLRGQNRLLLVASYFFYGWWDWRLLSLLLLTTTVDYFVARGMEAAPERRRKHLLLVSIAVNLGILGFFKYFHFFVDSATALLNGVGLHVRGPTLAIILPVGISFYTFQEMSYVIDVYRKRLSPCRSLLDFALFVTYFPQLVAGPIERATNLLPQIVSRRQVTYEKIASGGVLVLIGLFRKVAIADVVAGKVERVFGNPGAHSSVEILLGIFLFAIQIYCDFAGYSDIARGTSRMLGIELMENFRHPYFATNITEFWRRWHISLSTWLRDYLYIPLGGNRGPQWFVYRNLLLTMLLGGLWHGASWAFVVWGGIHGVALAVHKLWRGDRAPETIERPLTARAVVTSGVSWIATMLVVGLSWVFFRAPDFSTAFAMLSGLRSFAGGVDMQLVGLAAVATALLLFIDLPQLYLKDHTAVLRWPAVVRGAVYAGLIMLLVVLRTGENVPFIYFQF